MKTLRGLRSGLAAALLALAACGGDAPATGDAVAGLPASFVVGTSDVAGGTAWDGVVQAVEQAVLSAQTAGRVAALAADVDQRVAAGAVLLRLTGEEQQAGVRAAEAQLASAEARALDAAARFRRASELVGRQLISRDEFDQIQAAHSAADAARDAAQAQVADARQQLSYVTVRAPYAGIVAARHVELGEAVAPGSPLFTLYSPRQLRLEVQIPQGDAEAVRALPAASVMLPGGREVQAASVTVYPAADPQAHSTTVRVQLPAMDSPPRPGQALKVRFAGARGPAGIWLPESAVVLRGELAATYVVQADTVLLRQLRLGRRADGRVEVIAGLVAGEAVATDPLAAMQWLRAAHGGTAAHSE